MRIDTLFEKDLTQRTDSRTCCQGVRVNYHDVIVPQFLLSGVIFPASSEPGALQWLSGVLPLTYAVNGMRDIMVKGADLSSSGLLLDAGVVAGFAILLIAAGTATLRRRLG